MECDLCQKSGKYVDDRWYIIVSLLQTQALRVGQVKEPCIGLTQENSIENSVQDSLPYIPWTHGPC